MTSKSSGEGDIRKALIEARAKRSNEEVANILICLINQASYLLWKQMQQLEEDFLKEGGFTEKMYHARKQARGR